MGIIRKINRERLIFVWEMEKAFAESYRYAKETRTVRKRSIEAKEANKNVYREGSKTRELKDR